MEIIPVSKRFTLMIDYAHNAMSLESLLTSLKQYKPKKLVTVIGCGGNRSKERRFEMGEVSSRLSDFTIVTSDNPRFEEPMDIINDILVGVKKADGEYVTVPDRKDAIRYAILNAKDGDVIILAGKGHEDYQEIKGVKHPMDERVLIKEIIEESLQNYGGAILVKDLKEAFEVSNYLAPEHLEVLVENPVNTLPYIKNAGSIFLGEYSPEPLGDYMSGTNHVLPTGGTAKFYSALGVYDFVKYSSYSYYPKDVLETFEDEVQTFAKSEGLDAHANSIAVRFEEE